MKNNDGKKESKVLEIALLPSFISVAKTMYSDDEIENGEVDGDAVRFNQGANIEPIEVEPGGEFEISIYYESGTITNEENNYKLIKKKKLGKRIIEEVSNGEDIVLEPSKYILNEDGITIEDMEIEDVGN